MIACVVVFYYASPTYGFSPNIGKEESVCPGGCSSQSPSDSSTPTYRQISPEEERRKAEEQRRKDEEERRAYQARDLNEAAVRLMQEQQYFSAAEKFGAALRLRTDPVYLGNLDHAEAELAFKEGRIQDAIDSIKSAIARGRTDLKNRLNVFEREQERQHDARLTAANRRVIEAAREPPSPLIPEAGASPGKWDELKPYAHSFLKGALKGEVPHSSTLSDVDHEEKFRSIYGGFVSRLYHKTMAAIDSLLHHDESEAQRYLDSLNGEDQTLRGETKEYAGKEVASKAGKDLTKWLSK
jgi:tetratricopeptide (TPR) repeat protein